MKKNLLGHGDWWIGLIEEILSNPTSLLPTQESNN